MIYNLVDLNYNYSNLKYFYILQLQNAFHCSNFSTILPRTRLCMASALLLDQQESLSEGVKIATYTFVYLVFLLFKVWWSPQALCRYKVTCTCFVCMAVETRLYTYYLEPCWGSLEFVIHTYIFRKSDNWRKTCIIDLLLMEDI